MPPTPTLSQIQERLAASRGRDYWRSLEELAETPGFVEFLHREFPRQASEWQPGMSRRGFLRLMAASLALAGLSACASPPAEKIVPAVHAPEGSGTGKPLYFATAMPLSGYGLGLLVQSHQNRPTKVEGNPDHPASLGAADAFAQASVLTLYDPDRAKGVTRRGEASDWPGFLAALRGAVDGLPSGGAGLRILSETVTSPTLAGQMQAIADAFPAAVWHQYEPVNRDNAYAGAALAFGKAVETIYRFEQARVILSLDSDCLANGPGRVRYARDFAAGRRAESAAEGFRQAQPASAVRNRLYAVESSPTLTGAAADHRLPLRAGEIGDFAVALARQVGLDVPAGAPNPNIPAAWVEAVAADLQANPGGGLVVVGDHQPPELHALAHALNAHLGNAGQTVVYTESVVANPESQAESLAALGQAMAAGEVELLLILGGDPLYTAPADVDFGGGLGQVGTSVHLSLYANATAAACDWHIAASYFLESWGDVRAFDGTVTIQQPLIAPLYDSHDAHQLLAALLSDESASAHDTVKNHWQTTRGGDDFDDFWRTSLHDGVLAASSLPPLDVSPQLDLAALVLPAANGNGLEVNFRADPTLWDGRFANNGWLQELPKPLTKLTWENAVLIAPLTAEGLGLATGDWVEIAFAGRAAEGPVWLLPGHPADSITLHLGHGQAFGQVAAGAGFNAYALRPSNALWYGNGVSLRKLRGGYQLASTQSHHAMEGRHLVREGTLAEYAENPRFVEEMAPHSEEISLYPKVEYETAWGMAVDLNACIGCNACVVACQAENNIPVVGKEQVAKGREMHWIRVDSYFQGDLRNPSALHQPVMCMHCENAPCEVVCPVAATVHDSDGLNVMVYNRCVGTRYCSNNCPYKVRRFNFLEYTELESESLALQRNPQVTVRSRGVMEKCTYCVQRISAARIDAKVAGRELADGDVVTACQAVCPTQAIVFGDQNDPSSRVAQLKASPLNYGLLTELNTHPRTTYLARLRNPNPALEEQI